MMPWKKKILAFAYIHVDENGLIVVPGKEVGTTKKNISIAVTYDVVISAGKRVFLITSMAAVKSIRSPLTTTR